MFNWSKLVELYILDEEYIWIYLFFNYDVADYDDPIRLMALVELLMDGFQCNLSQFFNKLNLQWSNFCLQLIEAIVYFQILKIDHYTVSFLIIFIHEKCFFLPIQPTKRTDELQFTCFKLLPLHWRGGESKMNACKHKHDANKNGSHYKIII